jgi:hypothetical protein
VGRAVRRPAARLEHPARQQQPVDRVPPGPPLPGLAQRPDALRIAASEAVRDLVADLGRTWSVETEVALGRDVREPFLLEVGGRLLLHFVELGDEAFAFEPRALWRSARRGSGDWTAPERWGEPGEVTWDFKVRRGRAWVTSYQGKHYGIRGGPIQARFRSSTDGVTWTGVGSGTVYRGGVSEISFEFDRAGMLWAVTRNEDGDATGFGSHVVTAPAERPGEWRFPASSDPERYDSPRLFRHGDDLYLLARRNVGSPIGSRWGVAPGPLRKLLLWSTYLAAGQAHRALPPGRRGAADRADPRSPVGRRHGLPFGGTPGTR